MQSLPEKDFREALFTHQISVFTRSPLQKILSRYYSNCAAPCAYPTRILPVADRSSRNRHTEHPVSGAASQPPGPALHKDPWWLSQPHLQSEPDSARLQPGYSRMSAALLSKARPVNTAPRTFRGLLSSCGAVKSTPLVLE